MDGTVSWLCGLKHAERMAVSMHSIRKHWDGSMLLVVNRASLEIGERIAHSVGADIAIREIVDVPRHGALISKTRLPDWCHYDRAVYFDADTVVVGDFRPMFEPAVGITQFAEWVSNGNIIGRRVRCYLNVPNCPPRIKAMVEVQQEKAHPAINTGVFSWHKGGEWVAEWQRAADLGASCVPLTDEIAMQIVFPGIIGHKVFDDRYNCSALHGVHRTAAVVWHFHGKKHLRIAEGRSVWEPAFQEAYAANVGGLQEWAGNYDPWIKRLVLEPGAHSDGQAIHLV